MQAGTVSNSGRRETIRRLFMAVIVILNTMVYEQDYARSNPLHEYHFSCRTYTCLLFCLNRFRRLYTFIIIGAISDARYFFCIALYYYFVMYFPIIIHCVDDKRLHRRQAYINSARASPCNTVEFSPVASVDRVNRIVVPRGTA
jgi:hypothetical protein